MPLIGKTCTQGLWDESVPGISFDEEGVSNFARHQETLMNQYPRRTRELEKWLLLMQKIQISGRNNRYNCIIGVNGGVQSSYLLHLANQYSLRPLAVILDNGFNSDIALRNILKVSEHLGIDLETYKVDYKEIKDLTLSYMRASLPWIDGPNELAYKGLIYRLAKKEGIKYILFENDFRVEGIEPKEWTYADNRQLSYIHKRFGDGVKLQTYPKLSLLLLTSYRLLYQIREVRPFYYLHYQITSAKQLLQRMYGWEDYESQHDENLFSKFAKAYWLPKKFGIDQRVIHLSAQILSGAISREEGMKVLAQPIASQTELESLKAQVLEKLELSDSEFEAIWKRENKSPFNYSSYCQLFFRRLKR